MLLKENHLAFFFKKNQKGKSSNYIELYYSVNNIPKLDCTVLTHENTLPFLKPAFLRTMAYLSLRAGQRPNVGQAWIV